MFALGTHTLQGFAGLVSKIHPGPGKDFRFFKTGEVNQLPVQMLDVFGAIFGVLKVQLGNAAEIKPYGIAIGSRSVYVDVHS